MPSARAALLAVLLLLSTPAAAGAQTPGTVADGLERDPVVVAGGATLDAGARGRVRLRIAERAVGRIAVAVVPERTLQRAGGAGPYANAVDAAMGGVRGTLLVTSGRSWHAVTSHDGDAAGALGSALARADGRPLEGRLLAAVDALAAVDPGPDAAPATPALPAPAADALQDVTSTVRWVLIGLAAVVGLPFLVVAALLAGRAVARARGTAEAHAEVLGLARERLLALGDGLRELDALESAPGASPAGRAAYGVVLERYDQADAVLRGEPAPRAVRRACRALDEAEAALATARSRLAGSEASLVGLGG